MEMINSIFLFPVLLIFLKTTLRFTSLRLSVLLYGHTHGVTIKTNKTNCGCSNPSPQYMNNGEILSAEIILTLGRIVY